jgi:hypothetical protein
MSDGPQPPILTGRPARVTGGARVIVDYIAHGAGGAAEAVEDPA